MANIYAVLSSTLAKGKVCIFCYRLELGHKLYLQVKFATDFHCTRPFIFFMTPLWVFKAPRLSPEPDHDHGILIYSRLGCGTHGPLDGQLKYHYCFIFAVNW